MSNRTLSQVLPIGSPETVHGAVPPVSEISLPSLVRLHRQMDVPTRWVLLALVGWIFYSARGGGLAGFWLGILAAYALITMITTVFWFKGWQTAAQNRFGRLVGYASFFIDTLFVYGLVWHEAGAGGALVILLVLLAVKAVILSQVLPGMVWLPFAFGPLYVAALWLASGNLGFLADPSFLSQYLVFLAWLLGVVFVGAQLTRRTQLAAALSATVAQQQAALSQKAEVLQGTARDLGDRLLELRSLQEVAKALATTLRTEETLELVVDLLARATGSSHSVAALIDRDSAAAARDGAALTGALLGESSSAPVPFRMPLSEEVVGLIASNSSRPLYVPADRGGRMGARLGGHPYFVTALVSRGHAIGVLYVAEHASAAVTSAARVELEPNAQRPIPHATMLNTSEQLLTTFAYFAATAIENARLYQDAYEKRRELEAVLAGIGDGVVVADTDLSLVLMNPVAREILGLETEPPGGVPLRPYLAAGGFAELLSKTLSAGQEQIRELDLPAIRRLGEETSARERIDGDERTYGALASPVLDATGEVSGVVAVLRDITMQKEVERMKSNFLSVVSHELRTPLHSIKGFVEIILMGKTGPVSELQEDFLKTVRTQTTALQRMIDDLLEFSRMEAGRVRLNLEEVSLAAIANGVGTKLAPLAEEGGLRLFMDFADDLPAIDGDRVRLEQVLTNLVENAIKFTPANGEVTIVGRHNGDRVRVTVHDTGIGVPPEEQEKVFERFYQVDRGENRAYRGTGLGLSISRHIVERHGGSIWVDSEGVTGRGSSFHVELPLELRSDEPPTIDFTTPGRGHAPRPSDVGTERAAT